MKEIIINEENKNQRFDKFLLKYFNNSSKSFIYKMLRKKRIKLNKKKAEGNEILQKNDIVTLYLSEETIDSFKKEKNIVMYKPSNLNIVFEDNNIIVVNKKSGILSQPIDKNDKNTINDFILSYLNFKNEFDISKDSLFTPSICNRLDRNTSGIVVAAKNLNSAQALNEIFSNNKIEKYYLALVNGIIKKEGIIKNYYLKDNEKNIAKISDDSNDKEIVTKYFPLSTNKEYTFLKIQIITGKSHQIRLHLSSIGHSIVGDYKYGNIMVNEYFKEKFNLKNQFLHASSFIINDTNGDLSYLNGKEITAKLPDNFNNILKQINLI